MDLMLVMDESGSIGPENFQKMKVFARDLLRNFKIGPYDMRVAVIKFSSTAYCVFKFYTYSSFGDISAALLNIAYVGGGTNIAAALRLARATTIYKRPNAITAAIVLTDGQSFNEEITSQEAQHLKNDTGTKVFSVGIGNYISMSELRSIASTPESQYLITTSNFNELYNKVQQFISGLCRGKLIETFYMVPNALKYIERNFSHMYEFTCIINDWLFLLFQTKMSVQLRPVPMVCVLTPLVPTIATVTVDGNHSIVIKVNCPYAMLLFHF